MMTEEELHTMTVKQLREFAVANTKLVGVTGMKKEELLDALMAELGIEKSKHIGGGNITDKKSAKKEIARLKQKKQTLLRSSAVSSKQLRNIRRRVHKLKKITQKIA
jgi:hypothetical protein